MLTSIVYRDVYVKSSFKVLNKMYITGSNIFGQWLGCNENIIEEFTTLPKNLGAFEFNSTALVHIGWSFNVFLCNDKVHIIGDYKSSGESIEIVSLPDDCMKSSNITVASDDHYLVVTCNNTCNIRPLSMVNSILKTFNINTEIPIDYEPKRLKQEVYILKSLAINGTLLLLTSDGLVYSGLLPSLVDTSHCVGKPLDIQCGYEHFMVLTDAGRVYTWGNGRRLQLGHGDISSTDTPTLVEALAGIKIIKLAAGGWHSLALSEFGDLYVWGWNDTGQLGVKEKTNKESLKSYPLPTLVDLIMNNGGEVNINVIDIACGTKHSAILLEDQTVWTTGNNKYGQLGVPVKSNSAVNYFKKVWTVSFPSKLMCGKWSTVIVNI